MLFYRVSPQSLTATHFFSYRGGGEESAFSSVGIVGELRQQVAQLQAMTKDKEQKIVQYQEQLQLINTISSGSQPQCLLGCILSLNHQKQSSMKGSISRFDFMFMSILQDVSLNFQHLVSLQI